MAPHLKRAKIGPAAVSPFRIHPIDIAASTSLLMDLAPGGAYIGLARGAWLSDHGIKEPEKPLTAIWEAVAIIRSLLAGETVSIDRDNYSLDRVKAPYPLPEDKVPLMIGTWGRKLGSLAGELADEVKVGGSTNPAMVQHMQQVIRVGSDRVGRAATEIGIVMGAVTVVDADRKAARRLARRQVALYLPVVIPLDPTIQIDPELILRIKDAVQKNNLTGAAELISDDLLDLFAFSGSPEDIIHQASNVFAAGASRIEFGTPHGVEPHCGIKLLGEIVFPQLADVWK